MHYPFKTSERDYPKKGEKMEGIRDLKHLIEMANESIGSKVFYSDFPRIINQMIDCFVKLTNSFNDLKLNDDVREAMDNFADVLVKLVSMYESDNINIQDVRDFFSRSINNSFTEFESVIRRHEFMHNKALIKVKSHNGRRRVCLYFYEEEELSKCNADSLIEVKDFYKIDYDYIAISSNNYKDIKSLLLELNILKEKILPPVMPFKPNESYYSFDIEEFLRLNNPDFSIISDNCWGAYQYKRLGLQYNTPFIWLYIRKNEYLKLLNNLSYYLSCKLKFIKVDGISHPVGVLDDIKIYFNHSASEREAEDAWNRRLKKLNWDNLFIQMTIESEEEAYAFDKLPYKNKIAFTEKDYQLYSCFWISEWEKPSVRERYEGFWQFVHTESHKYFDVVSWLNKVQE
ncbi:DUF1919 domain-containing protein [Brevibacillus sp. Leaf182]|uniref:DUF1919 domain-containing protein n=1 Tax=Brevibacillus sp. Leaf182 TaxID=1736290 RepID=UPI0006F8CEF9|nr:DUF1919 domain-containing protein [Brevibacillus sp. Leaf182]RAT98710.1 DUF1919 domain-containing protein [Brevibacillus sp. Leaf182]